MGKKLIILILCLGFGTLTSADKIYVPSNIERLTTPRDQLVKPKPEPLRSMVSQKNLLGLDRDTPFGLPKSKQGVPLSLATQEDSIHVLVLKIDFQTENPDDPSTTGNGNLDLRSAEEFFADEGHMLDPAPHNSTYFAAHMRALNRYWYNVSDHRLKITWDIYPQAETASFRLPDYMSYYGTDGPWADSGVVAQLANFVKDAIILADTLAPEIQFSRYQSVIIFHAGSDQQNNLYFVEDTYNDFWTGFLWTDDTTIVVDSGTVEVHECTIMPETASQDNRVTVLNAVLVHEFGHQLGLVDIYNTLNFLTTVGDFSLMDNNGQSVVVELGDTNYTALVTGVLPIFPDAWSRAYLGFSGVREIADGDTVSISAAEQLYYSDEIIKIPITDYEYFLIENRQIESDFRYRSFQTSDTIPFAIKADSATGVILGPVYGYYDIHNNPVTFDSYAYDYIIPAHGLLIWHVDETVAYMNYTGQADNFLMNTLQWDPDRRFVKLIEADGVEDFGGNYVTWNYYGIDADAFKAGNNTALTPSTRPDSRSNMGANTHISITDISDSDTIMTCNVSVDWYQEGFPVMAFPFLGNGDGGILALDIDADGYKEIISARSKYLMGVNHDGSPVTDTSIYLILPNFDYDTLSYVWPLFDSLDTGILGRIAAGDIDGDDSLEIICFDANSKLYLFEGYDRLYGDNLADLIDTMTFAAALTAGPVIYDFDGDGVDDIIAGFDDSIVRLITYVSPDSAIVRELITLVDMPRSIAISDTMAFIVYGQSEDYSLLAGYQDSGSISIIEHAVVQLPSGEPIGLICGDINRDNLDDAVAAVGNHFCIYDGDSRTIKTLNIENPGPPSLGDINADGYPDIIIISGDRFLTVYAYNYKGYLLDGFPVRIMENDYAAINISQPLIGDMDDDGNPDVIISYTINKPLQVDLNNDGILDEGINDLYSDLSVGGLTALNYQGDILGDFPLAVSTSLLTEPLVSDLDGDNDLELALLDSAGFIAVWDLESPDIALNQPWSTANADIYQRSYLARDYEKAIAQVAGFLPENSVYNYPNPASDLTTFRYYVDRPADIDISIYDMTGELVDHLAHRTDGGTVPDEVVWDCSRFASGVYFARIEAKASDMNKNMMIKVALIK
jgi:M6 family metalloprotease-like protein